MSQKISDFDSISPEELESCAKSSNAENPTQFCYAGATFIGNGIVKNVKVNLTDYFYTKDEINFKNNNLENALVPGNILSSKNNQPISTNIKATELENHIIDADDPNPSFHVTSEEKNKWDDKQDKLGTIFSDIIFLKSNPNLNGKLLYINSEGNIDIYNNIGVEHFNDDSIHVSEADRNKWNSTLRYFPDYTKGYTIHWTEDDGETKYSSIGKDYRKNYPELPASPSSSDLGKEVKFHPRWVYLKSGKYQPSLSQFVKTNPDNNKKDIYFTHGAADGAAYVDSFGTDEKYKTQHPNWWKKVTSNNKSTWNYKGANSEKYSAGNDLQLHPFYRSLGYTFRDTEKNNHSCIIPPLGKDALYIIEFWEGDTASNNETWKIEYREPNNISKPFDETNNKWKAWSYIGSYCGNDISRLELQIPGNAQIRLTLFRTDSATCKIIAFPYRYTNE